MTFDLMTLAGIKTSWEEEIIHIYPKKIRVKKYFHKESDWSSASYYYSMAAIARQSHITSVTNNESLQGDRKVASIYDRNFGIITIFDKNAITLKKKIKFSFKKSIELNLNKTPDIAQTIVVTCAVLGIKCILKGLERLKIKETDRLLALKEELFKFGVTKKITDSCLEKKSIPL